MGAEDEKLEGQEEKGTTADEQKEDKPDTAKPEDKKDTKDKGEDIKDKHGQPGINAEKYKRDIEAKDAKIAELEAQVAKAAETKEGREKLEKQIADLKAEQAEERVTHKLELAGCRSVKAAKALLDDFDGDVSKLKAEHPYLFEADKKTGRAGGKPGGAPDGMDAKIAQAMGGEGLESLIASQFVTAPKPFDGRPLLIEGLIASQFVTAPKRCFRHAIPACRLIASQFVTAPKLSRSTQKPKAGLIASQFVTAPKLISLHPLP